MNALENRIAELEATLLSAESALKIAEALIEKVEKERDDYHKKACDIADERDTLRARLQEAEAYRAKIEKHFEETGHKWVATVEALNAKLSQQAEALRAAKQFVHHYLTTESTVDDVLQACFETQKHLRALGTKD